MLPSRLTTYLMPGLRVRRTVPPGTRISSVRALHATSPRSAYKDSQSKDSLAPRSQEYSRSGGDDAAAATDTAFDPNNTSPEGQTKSAEQESGAVRKNDSDANPLDASPASKEVNDQNTSGETERVQKGAEKTPSSGGSPKKAGGGKSGGGTGGS